MFFSWLWFPKRARKSSNMFFFHTFGAFVFEVVFWRVFWMIFACENLQKTYTKQWFSSFFDFLKKCKQILQNRTKKGSEITKNQEKHPFEIMLFFCIFFPSFLVDFGSILESILLLFCRFFPSTNQAFPLGGREVHFLSILSDFEWWLGDFWMIFEWFLVDYLMILEFVFDVCWRICGWFFWFLHAKTFKLHTKNNGFQAFPTFWKSSKKYSKILPKYLKNHKNQWKTPSRNHIDFRQRFFGFFLDFGSILGSILASCLTYFS